MFSNVLPLRAVIFQFLFLLIAISLEAFVLRRILNLDYKTSMQYAATVNLLSTFVGWLIFFNLQPLLPEQLKAQLISYIFFERFFTNPWLVSVAPILILLSLIMFMGTFLLKLKGLELLEVILEKPDARPVKPVERIGKFRGINKQNIGFKRDSKAYAVLLANSISFSAILLLLILRLVAQNQMSVI